MRGSLQRLLLRQPVGDAARRVGFGVLALVLVVAELVSGGAPAHLGVFTVEWLVIGYGLLALTALRHSAWFGEAGLSGLKR